MPVITLVPSRNINTENRQFALTMGRHLDIQSYGYGISPLLILEEDISISCRLTLDLYLHELKFMIHEGRLMED